jgi:hypothetical protein
MSWLERPKTHYPSIVFPAFSTLPFKQSRCWGFYFLDFYNVEIESSLRDSIPTFETNKVDIQHEIDFGDKKESVV